MNFNIIRLVQPFCRLVINITDLLIGGAPPGDQVQVEACESQHRDEEQAGHTDHNQPVQAVKAKSEPEQQGNA